MWLLRLLKLAALITPLVPARAGYWLCRVFGILYWLFNHRARSNVLQNLRQVSPRASWLKRLILSARVCVTVVTNYYDLIRMRSVDRDSVLDLVEIDGLEHVGRAMDQGRGAIVLSAHIGNFSVMARLPAALGYDAALIAERVEPPALYSYMARLRSAMGIEVIPPDATLLRRVIRLLNRNGILLLAGDRDVTGSGQRVTFFGRETSLPAGPVMLAMRTGAPILPAYTLRDSRHRSRVWISPPIELTGRGNREDDLQTNLEHVAGYLEQMIARDPGQWAVLQRVWPPTSRFGRSEGLGSADDAFSDADDRETSGRPGNDSAVLTHER